ncbi:hypothetical protein ACM66B_004725 [Microbotryomycetes sp. NB124-2]
MAITLNQPNTSHKAANMQLTEAQASLIPSSSLPIGPQVSHLLQQFTTLSLQLFSSLSTSSPTAAITPIMSSLAEIDSKLARLLTMLARHQALQQKIDQLVSQVQARDDAWQQGVKTLHSALNDLRPIVESGSEDRQAIEQARAANDNDDACTLDPKTILSYARLLAPFTSAPPSSLVPPEQKIVGQGATTLDPSGNRLPMGAIPPFPTEAVMRRGRLQFGTTLDGISFGETDQVGARRDLDEGAKLPSTTDAPVQQSAAAKLAQQARRQEQQQHEQEDFSFDLDLNPDM